MAVKSAFGREEEAGEQVPDVRWTRAYYSEEGKIHREYQAPNLQLLYEFDRGVGTAVPAAVAVVQNLEPSWCR